MPAPPARGVARLAWLDYAKAAGIALVVFGHASRSIERSGLAWPEALKVADQLIYSFHMPLFFVLAGYASTLSRRRDIPGFVKGTWWGLVVPYLVWSIIWVGLKTALPGAANTPVEAGALAHILWAPVEHFWFLYDLFFARVIWFALDPPSNPRLSWAALAAVLLATVVFAFGGWDAPRLAGILTATAFYGAGALLLPRAFETMDRRPVPIVVAAAVLWLLLVMSRSGVTFDAKGVLAALLGAGVVIILARVAPEPRSLGWRAVAFVGEASLVIYLLHLFFAAAARLALERAGVLDAGALLVAATVAGLAGPLVIHVAVLALNGRTGMSLSPWMGFGTLTRSSYFGFSDARPARAPSAAGTPGE